MIWVFKCITVYLVVSISFSLSLTHYTHTHTHTHIQHTHTIGCILLPAGHAGWRLR